MAVTVFSSSMQDLAREALSVISRNRVLSTILAVGVLSLSVGYAVFRPAEYVASMIIAPIETSATDATSQLLSSGISFRPQLSLNSGPPPEMSAFLKIMKSPEMARYLVADPKAKNAIIDDHKGILRQLKAALGIPQEDQVSAIQHWLDAHITVDQDVDLMTWTINLRHPDAQSASYILSQVERGGEEILRRSAIKQYDTQHRYVVSQIDQETDANVKATLYTVLAAIERSLVVLRSGSNFATAVISEPFVPSVKSYPARLMSFAIALIVLLLAMLLVLVWSSFRSLNRRRRDAVIADLTPGKVGRSASAPSYSHS